MPLSVVAALLNSDHSALRSDDDICVVINSDRGFVTARSTVVASTALHFIMFLFFFLATWSLFLCL